MTDDTSETVYVTTPGGARIYHTDPECSYGPADPRPRDREMMDAWGYDCCGHCDGDVDRSGPYGNESELERILDERDGQGDAQS